MKVKFTSSDFEITTEQRELLNQIGTIRDHVIVRVKKADLKSGGGIVLSSKDVEKSTIGVVLKPNKVSYHRNGDPTSPVLQQGHVVRLQRGNVGTSMPESPEGEEWICVPEDCIYYYRKVSV